MECHNSLQKSCMDFFGIQKGLISVAFSKVDNRVQTIVFERNFILNMLGCLNSRLASTYINLIGFQNIYIFIENLINFDKFL
jgi:hypothetical protein